MLPSSTNVSIDLAEAGAKSPAAKSAAAVAVFVTEGSTDAGEAGALLGEPERAGVARLLAAGVSRGKAREVHFDLIDAPAQPTQGKSEGKSQGKQKGPAYRRVLVAGLGPAEKVTNEVLRQAAGAVAKAARKQRVKDVTVVLPDLHRGGGPGPATGRVRPPVRAWRGPVR